MPLANAEQPFPDVPLEHPAAQAIRYLQTQERIRGYENGSFRPEKLVNRAEAVKLIVAPLVTSSDLLRKTSTLFSDIPSGSWYLPYVEYARSELGIVAGPPNKGKFHGEDTVLLVEFLKMLLSANGVDVTTDADAGKPLASDVPNGNEWYVPYLRYALSTAMVRSENELLSPGKPLTRADIALILFHFDMYREGRRTQALLSEIERELLIALAYLGTNDLERVEFAVNRAVTMAEGVRNSRKGTPIVEAVFRVAEAFQSLTQAYRAGLDGDLHTTVERAGDAWHSSLEAQSLDESVTPITEKLREEAHTMAEEARALYPVTDAESP